MQQVIAFIITILGLTTFSFLKGAPKEEAVSQPQETVSRSSVSVNNQTYLKSAPKLPESKSTISVNTSIISGPEEGEVINETNKVTFKSEAEVFPKETEGRILFETKAEGLDDSWKETSFKERTITFPSGPKEYTFLVRAKIKDSIDSTPAKRTLKINVSPYFDKVKIADVNLQTSSRPSLITLNIYLGKEEKINITGWSVKSMKGSFVIPLGTEKYYSDYTPVPTDNIIIKNGDKVYLSSASNPLGKGMNFRPNKCLGYFITNNRNFSVSFSKNCPGPEKEEISHLDPCCQEFILNLGRCEIPNYSSNSRISPDSECVAYLNENLNYNGCYRKYSQDEDFIGKDWHIYMDFELLATNKCDTLYLLDQNGLFIDKYPYVRDVCK